MIGGLEGTAMADPASDEPIWCLIQNLSLEIWVVERRQRIYSLLGRHTEGHKICQLPQGETVSGLDHWPFFQLAFESLSNDVGVSKTFGEEVKSLLICVGSGEEEVSLDGFQSRALHEVFEIQ